MTHSSPSFLFTVLRARSAASVKPLKSLALVLGVMLMLAGCSVSTNTGGVPSGTTPRPLPTAATTESPAPCGLGTCYTPEQLRDAYNVTPLLNKGYTGKGQTVVLIESYGSPTIQQDLDTFDQQFGLPPLTVKVLSPLGTVPFDSGNSEMTGWQGETTLDVETVHAIAPGANITILTSPVDETEGVQGIPQFLQLEQYAVQNHLGNIISQSWAASEVSLDDPSGKAAIAPFDAFFKQATTQDGVTFFGSTGDNGATDCVVYDENTSSCTQYSSSPTIAFPAGDPWVTAAGGTSLNISGSSVSESAWNGSNGGVSRFYSEPSYQQSLPTSDQRILNGKRAVPDIAASADPSEALAIYTSGSGWQPVGGTSAASPLWAGLTAIADQMAGHGLGFLNPKLYQIAASSKYAQDFNDITTGDNTNSSENVQGYPATTGWDPVTGLGTPNAANLLPDLVAA